MNDRNRCGSRAVRVGPKRCTKPYRGLSSGASERVSALNAKQRCQACSVLGGSSARATPSTTTRLLPCRTQRVSNTARRPTTRVAWTVVCSSAPTSAVPRKARRCVRYSEPGCARSGVSPAALSCVKRAERTKREPMMAGNMLATSKPGTTQACNPTACAAPYAQSRAAVARMSAHSVKLEGSAAHAPAGCARGWSLL